jgi:Mannosyl-glycoprotein endo-beta-N-acetylglucosaminidase
MSFLDTLRQLFGGQSPQDQKMQEAPQWIRDQMNQKQQEVGRYSSGVLTQTTPPNYSNTANAFIPVPDNFNSSNPDQFAQVAQPLADTYGVPMAVAMGQKFGENRGEPAAKNNFYNIGAGDANPELANTYDSPVHGIESYMKMITGQAEPSFYGNGEKGRQAYSDAYQRFLKTKNTKQFLIDIQNAGYAGDPATWAQRSNSGYSSYSDFISNTPEYKKYGGIQ